MQFIFRGRYAITPGLSKALEAIDALTGRKNMNPDQKQFLDAISIRARSYERDLAFGVTWAISVIKSQYPPGISLRVR